MRSGFFVDANLLVLLIVGNVRRSLVDRHPRLKEYSVSDYDLLVSQLKPESVIYVTPNTLTETSNLLPFGPERLRISFLEELRAMIEDSEEIVVASKDASARPEFEWLGLTDSVLVESASRETPVLTADFRLWSEIASRDPDAALNFHQMRR